MFDKAWAFDPSSARYDVSFYAPNYFLFGRYTTDLNTAPFDPLRGGDVLSRAPSSTPRSGFPGELQVQAVDHRRPSLGAWVAYTQQSQWQLYNDSAARRGVPRDQLHCRR